ncbi:MAG: CinA family nicotinamide mononucleotide deamidase-related protein [Kiritimatiellae bacterium]|nr:CinA family nicotinamide mononucleotide deamidase-related protein [Kiritimatiellia bacterium]
MNGPRIELISSGSELLNGGTVNRHAQALGAALDAEGYTLSRDTTIGDQAEEIRDALSEALDRAEVVVFSGGLGPTGDDLTRGVVAEMLGCGVVMHEPSRLRIVERYRFRRKPLNNLVEQHALVVEQAEVLDNAAGLAPGELLRIGGAVLFLLPGPPSEFQAILTDHVMPFLRKRWPCSPVRTIKFHVAGLGESDLLARMHEAKFPFEEINPSFRASPGQVLLTLTHPDEARLTHAGELVQSLLTVRELVALSHDTVASVVADLLTGSGQTLAVAESCTGGGLGEQLTALPGSSRFFVGGVIAYANAVKESLLDVPAELLADQGAVSGPVAAAMAVGVRTRLGADWGVSITGVAGPGGGTDDKPVGLVYIGVAGPEGSVVREIRFGGSRSSIRNFAMRAALNLLREHLVGGCVSMRGRVE